MHLYVELWKVRPAWLALSAEERVAYVARLGHPYMAVWKLATLDLALALERAVEGAGWHAYFEQVNARGAMQPLADVLAHMARGSQP